MAEHGSNLQFIHPPPDAPPAGEGINKISDAEFARHVNRGNKAERVTDDSPAAKQRNLERAYEELALISELRSSKPFNWFFDVCVRKNFSECRTALESPDVNIKALPLLQTNFQQWRKAIRFLDEREYEQRRLIDPKDPLLAELRQRIDLH